MSLSGDDFVHSERLPFISQGGAYIAVGSPTGGSNDVVLNIVLSIYYGVAGNEDLSPGFLACSWALRSSCLGAVLSGRCQM